jgi:hypothetical protein
MAKKILDKLSPKYSFILNQYSDEPLSKCPLCHRPTHKRKFALLMHIDQWGLMVMGKTCKYCSPCELIISHKHELESELSYKFSTIAPEMIGKKYLVIGTVEKNIWQKGLKGNLPRLEEILEHSADFEKVHTLELEKGGWYPAKKEILKR